MRHLEKAVATAVTSLPDDSTDTALILQYESHFADYKAQLAQLRKELLSTDDILKDDPLLALHADLERQLFECSLLICRRLGTQEFFKTSTASNAGTGVKLPKLDVPIIDGNILNWTRFWEQFCVAVHDRTNISDAEKLLYLQQALMDGSAKSVIEELTRSGEYYTEAVDCLKVRFNRPRLIHQAHVKCIVQSTPLKEGSEKVVVRSCINYMIPFSSTFVC